MQTNLGRRNQKLSQFLKFKIWPPTVTSSSPNLGKMGQNPDLLNYIRQKHKICMQSNLGAENPKMKSILIFFKICPQLRRHYPLIWAKWLESNSKQRSKGILFFRFHLHSIYKRKIYNVTMFVSFVRIRHLTGLYGT